ncbi:contact-dependent growth inhibition system immunity protein [Bowmanella denitrificans]|uniref:contact-dependent growth inhibition system immunity protein n=1 Tax=Bowmanella denitrificans TaxID=366582 RepID=UPI000C9B58EA|nr:contact-dependent growth inhibition system immunity protein [Bowmanella denitrificans]
MNSTSERYTALKELISGWFHQDYDLEGDSITEIMSAFMRSCSTQRKKQLSNDIADFLSSATGPLDNEFEMEFQPDVDPKAFSGSARRFLEEIKTELEPER